MSTRTNRGRRWWLLPIAFVVVPIVEIYVIIQVGQVIGAWWTIALLVADSMFGAWLVKREGGRAWRALRVALAERRMPSQELADGALILVGGTLMVTPGFVTDIAGTLLVLPFTRPVGRRLLAGVITRHLVGAINYGAPAGAAAGQTRTSRDADRPGPDVVRGDVFD